MADAVWDMTWAGELAHLAPWPADDLPALHAHFQDWKLYELAGGLGALPAPDYLRRCIYETHDISVWRLTRHGVGPVLGCGVWSRYTTLDHIYVALFDAAPAVDLELWGDAIDVLSR